jgi:hypothetical protein
MSPSSTEPQRIIMLDCRDWQMIWSAFALR